MPLKIAILSVTDHGGAGKAAHRLHQGLQKTGVESTMLVLSKKTDDDTVKLLPGAVEAWKTATRRWVKNMREYPDRPPGLETFTDAESTILLDQIPEVWDADVINLHWIAGLLDYDTARWVLAEKPSVWTLHDMHPFTGGCHYSMGCDRYLEACGSCPALGRADKSGLIDGYDLSRSVWWKKDRLYEKVNAHVVAPSRWLKSQAQTSWLMSIFKVHHIPYGLPTDIYKSECRDTARKRLNLPVSYHMVLFGADRVSNPRKGFGHLVEAIKHLIKQKDDTPIIFATFGSDPPSVNLPAPHMMIHFGSIDDEHTLARIYLAADVFVIPTEADNLPQTVSEAMSCGTPVVGFSVGGVPEMIEHKVTGYLAQPFEAEELTEGIQWVLSQKCSTDDLQIRCRESALSKYRPSLQAKAYLKLFESIVKGEKK